MMLGYIFLQQISSQQDAHHQFEVPQPTFRQFAQQWFSRTVLAVPRAMIRAPRNTIETPAFLMTWHDWRDFPEEMRTDLRDPNIKALLKISTAQLIELKTICFKEAIEHMIEVYLIEKENLYEDALHKLLGSKAENVLILDEKTIERVKQYRVLKYLALKVDEWPTLETPKQKIADLMGFEGFKKAIREEIIKLEWRKFLMFEEMKAQIETEKRHPGCIRVKQLVNAVNPSTFFWMMSKFSELSNTRKRILMEQCMQLDDLNNKLYTIKILGLAGVPMFICYVAFVHLFYSEFKTSMINNGIIDIMNFTQNLLYVSMLSLIFR